MWKRTEPEPRPGSLFHAGVYMSRAEVGVQSLGICPARLVRYQHAAPERKKQGGAQYADRGCEDKLKAGIFGGVYPFGEVIDRVEGLTKNDCYTVYTAFLQKWIEERRVG